jgi:hypothetical protein
VSRRIDDQPPFEEENRGSAFWLIFAATIVLCVVSLFQFAGGDWPQPSSDLGSLTSIVTTAAWTSLFVLVLRIVYSQYGPLLRRYPKIEGGPSHSAQLAFSGLLVLAIGGIAIGLSASVISAALSSFAVFGLVLTLGGASILWTLGGRWRFASRRQFNNHDRVSMAFSRHDMMRGIVGVTAQWIAIGIAASASAEFFPRTPLPMAGALGLLFGASTLCFQVMPHLILSSKRRFIRTPSLPLSTWARDCLAVFVIDWGLISANLVGLSTEHGRFVAIVPILLAVSAMVGLKVFEIDQER